MGAGISQGRRQRFRIDLNAETLEGIQQLIREEPKTLDVHDRSFVQGLRTEDDVRALASTQKETALMRRSSVHANVSNLWDVGVDHPERSLSTSGQRPRSDRGPFGDGEWMYNLEKLNAEHKAKESKDPKRTMSHSGMRSQPH